jgi:hypothetical protein
MIDPQRESAAKYLYDISKGMLLLTVGNQVATGAVSWITSSIGSLECDHVFCLGLLA